MRCARCVGKGFIQLCVRVRGVEGGRTCGAACLGRQSSTCPWEFRRMRQGHSVAKPGSLQSRLQGCLTKYPERFPLHRQCACPKWRDFGCALTSLLMVRIRAQRGPLLPSLTFHAVCKLVCTLSYSHRPSQD